MIPLKVPRVPPGFSFHHHPDGLFLGNPLWNYGGNQGKKNPTGGYVDAFLTQDSLRSIQNILEAPSDSVYQGIIIVLMPCRYENYNRKASVYLPAGFFERYTKSVAMEQHLDHPRGVPIFLTYDDLVKNDMMIYRERKNSK